MTLAEGGIDLFMPRDGWTFVGAYRKADHAL